MYYVREKKQIKKIESRADAARTIGVMGVVAGVGALAIALCNVCSKDFDIASICAVSGAFSTVVGAMNLNDARKSFARAKKLRETMYDSCWHDPEYY